MSKLKHWNMSFWRISLLRAYVPSICSSASVPNSANHSLERCRHREVGKRRNLRQFRHTFAETENQLSFISVWKVYWHEFINFSLFLILPGYELCPGFLDLRVLDLGFDLEFCFESTGQLFIQVLGREAPLLVAEPFLPLNCPRDAVFAWWGSHILKRTKTRSTRLFFDIQKKLKEKNLKTQGKKLKLVPSKVGTFFKNF